MAQGTYQDFELDVEQDGVKILKARAGTRTRQGEVANPDFALPAEFDLAQLEEIIGETIGQAEGRSDPSLTEGEFTLEIQQDAMAYGRFLFSALFPQNSALLNKYIGSYHQAAAAAEGRGVPMRLRLRLRPDLAAIPWEILSPTANVPGQEQFLAMGMSISRRPPSITGPAEPYAITRPLRMLLVADDAYMEEKERLAQQRDLILEALDPLGEHIVVDTLEMGPDDHSTLEAIARYLETQEYQILHFMGHGYLDLDQETPIGYLVMTKDGESSAFRDRTVAEVFQGGMGKGQGLRLVVLNACEGARGRPQYTGVAQAMLDVGVPAVVAMQNLLSDPAARRFAQSFYPRLAETLSVDEAIRYAREHMNRHIVGTMEWSSPVLFFTGDGPLFTRPARPEVSRSVEDPLGAEAVAVRGAYLRMVREVSGVLGEKDYYPIQVTRSTSVLQRTTTDGALPQASLYAYPAADARDSAVDAIDSLVDRKTRQATQRVNVLLGRPGAGKTTVVNQVVGVLAPDKKKALLDELAKNPETLIPIRVPMNDISLEGPANDLALLVFKAMSRVWTSAAAAAESKADKSTPAATAEREPDKSTPAAAAEREADEGRVNLPSLESLRGWVSSEAWHFLIIFEEMEEIMPSERRRAGQLLQSFMQVHVGHNYLLTSSRPAFLDYVYYAGAASQWEIASLSRSTVRRALEKAKLDVQREDMIALLRQPWALVTYRQMHAEGEAIVTPADLLRGRVDLLLDKIPHVKQRHQKQRLLETLMRLALDIETLAQDETAEPKIPVEMFFELMAEVRGERTYDLESMLAGLIDVGFLRLDAAEECVYFADPHLRAILSAMAMDRRLTPAFLAARKLSQPGSQSTLVLLAQLSEASAQAVVEALLERLNDRDMTNRWDARLELLNLAVQCLTYHGDGRGGKLRREVIGQLARMFVRPEDEGRLADLDDFSLAGAEQNVCRLPRTTMRIEAVRLLGRLGDPRAFELFRWLIVERVRGDESCDSSGEPETRKEGKRRFARSSVRRAAALSAYELSQSGRLVGFLKGNGQLARLRELLEAWQQSLDDDEKERVEAVNTLASWLAPEEEAWFSSIVAVALAEIAARYQLAEGDRASESEQVIAVLTAAFTTADEDTRWAIADGADSLSGTKPELVAPFLAMLEEMATGRRNRDFAHGRDYREPAVYALGKLRSLESIPTLSQVLTMPGQPAEITGRAARGLGECSVDHRDDPQVEEALANLIQVVDSFRLGAGEAWEVSVRSEAVGSLGYIADRRAVPVLVDVIAEDAHRTSQPARERAALALMQILGREAAAKLLQERLPEELNSGTLPLARRVLKAVGEIDLPLAVKALEDGILESWLATR